MAPKPQHPLARVKSHSGPSPSKRIAVAKLKRNVTSQETRPKEPPKPPPSIPLDYIDEDGNTGLHRAVLQEQYIYILDASKHAGRRNKAQKTALHLAAEKGDFTAISHLVLLTGETGVRVGASVKCGGYVTWKPTALMICALLNHSAQLVQSGEEDVKLHEALRALVKAESRKQDWSGYTALMYACIAGNTHLAMELAPIEAGIQSKGGWSALMLATQLGRLPIVAKLYRREYGLQNAGGWTALMDAAVNGYLEIAHLLASKERGMCTRKGRTALMLAVSNGHVDIAALLLKEGGHEDSSGYSALMYAVQKGHLALVRLLGPIEGEIYAERALRLLKDTVTPEVRARYQKAIAGCEQGLSERDVCDTLLSEGNTTQNSSPPSSLSECTDPEFLVTGLKYSMTSYNPPPPPPDISDSN
ncbi:Protein 21.1 [Giardia lamblia P15]|uniref:Protein 21.1 n=1 Tax=Giardia intestinalis (strain P15) TaxID=658858 RepID=E1F489_GIAIA|nr:Protein 21.1 [Giardia lamblia P15]